MKKIYSLNFRNRKAFTLIEILMVMAIMGILTTVSITGIESVANDVYYDKTYERMLLVKGALIGDLDTTKQGLREYFGYLGDMGSLPTALQGLQALLTRPSGAPTWSINATSKTGMGWRGPYLKGTVGVDWLKDAWGRDLIYNTTGTPYIRSYGSDGVAGGTGHASDIQLNLDSSITTSTIYGVINENGKMYTSTATVELYEPDGSGNLASPVRSEDVEVADNGAFTFSNVTFGPRALKVYFPNSAAPSDTIGPIILSVDNPKYVIPHNFLDSAPGALPHTCANVDNINYVTDSIDISTINNRVYFQLDIAESMTINTVYVQVSNGAKFQGMRIGNDTEVCDCSATTGFKCLTFSFFGLGFLEVEDTSAPCETDLDSYPEIQLSSGSWTIPAGNRIGAYIQFDTVTSLTWLDLRLACNLIRIQ